MKKIIFIISILLFFSNIYAQEQEHDAMAFLTVKGRYITTAGAFYDDWESGTAMYLTYGNISSNHWAVILQAGFNSFKKNEKANYTSDAKYNMFVTQVGGRYYFLLDDIRPYLLAMSGINFISEDFMRDGDKVKMNHSEFNFQVGIGTSVLIVSDLELDLSAVYNSHMLNPNKPYNITGIEYGVGFNWRFH